MLVITRREGEKLYINGQGSPVGADQLQTCRGDVVEWLVEDISNE